MNTRHQNILIRVAIFFGLLVFILFSYPRFWESFVVSEGTFIVSFENGPILLAIFTIYLIGWFGGYNACDLTQETP